MRMEAVPDGDGQVDADVLLHASAAPDLSMDFPVTCEGVKDLR